MRLFTKGSGHAAREVVGSNSGRDTKVGKVFNSNRQLAKFSPPNMSYIVNLFTISPRREAIYYRPCAFLSFEIANT